jgi:hypothetical protein
MTESVFGSLLGTPNVENAVLATYRAWMVEYLAEVERQNSLPSRSLERPPTPESFHGGEDFDTWQEDLCPEVIVVCNPTGEPERSASAGYGQAYEVQVGCVVIADTEDEARIRAGYWGVASMLLVQHGGLGGLAEWTVMTAAPKVEFPDPEQRRLLRSVTTFHVWVVPIISASAGPVGQTPKESPEYGGEPEASFKEDPTVTSIHPTVEGEAL